MLNQIRVIIALLPLIALVTLSSYSHADDSYDEYDDPEYFLEMNEHELRDNFEKRNRSFFKVHKNIDKLILKPVARKYRKRRINRSKVHNFLKNMEEPLTMVNSILTLDPRSFFRASGRFLINSTFGFFGFNDFALKKGVNRKEVSFSDTLRKFKVKEGSYIFVPVLGPQTSREFVGFIIDGFLSPARLLPIPLYYTLSGVKLINTRAELMEITDNIENNAMDEYVFIKNAYTQSLNRH